MTEPGREDWTPPALDKRDLKKGALAVIALAMLIVVAFLPGRRPDSLVEWVVGGAIMLALAGYLFSLWRRAR